MALFNGERVFPDAAQFFPANHQPLGVTEGALWYDNIGKQYLAIINGVATPIASVTSILGSNNIFTGTNTFQNTVSHSTSVAATSGANQNSPTLNIVGQYWTGSVSAFDTWTLQNTLGAGTNPIPVLALTHSGSSNNVSIDLTAGNTVAFTKVSNLQITGGAGTAGLLFETGATSTNAIRWPTANPTGNQLVAFAAGNPISMFFVNSPMITQQFKLTAQSAAQASTKLIDHTIALPSSQYQIAWTAKVTQVATTSSTLGALSITYTEPDGTAISITATAQSAAGTIETTDTGNSLTTVLLGVPLTINVKSGTDVFFTFGYASSGATAMQYNFNIIAESLNN